MRLIHVIAETGYSGGEVQLEWLVQHLQARGHDNHVVCPPGAQFVEVCERIGVPVELVHMRRPWARPATLQLRRFVARIDPDVVHFGCGRSTLWGGLALLGLRRPLKVATRRIDYPVARGPFGGWRYRHFVDHVIANCESVRDRLLETGMPPDHVTLIHEGIEVERWSGAVADRVVARRRLGLPEDAQVVSCAATLRPRKGQRVLIDAFAGIATRFPKAVLVLAGTGSDAGHLAHRARRVGYSERILLPGPIRPIYDLHAASDVSVMASYHEGLSNACLEASAAGVPLVVSAVGGLPELVDDGVTGYVVPAGDSDRLGDRIGALLGDDDARARAGRAGQERTCARFTAERMARATEALLLRLYDHHVRPDGESCTSGPTAVTARARASE